MVIRVGPSCPIPPVTCINCANPFRAVMNVEGEASPSTDAFVVCSRCGHIMGFSKNMNLRSLTGEDIAYLAQVLARRK